MPIMFNTVLRSAGLALEDVRLLRHQDNRAERGRTPYDLWRGDRDAFNLYQSVQRIDGRPKFKSRYWASFVGTPDNGTLFVGIYRVEYRGLSDIDIPSPSINGVHRAGTCDLYDLTADEACSDLIARMFIDWGEGTRAWVQARRSAGQADYRIAHRVHGASLSGFSELCVLAFKIGKAPGWVGRGLAIIQGCLFAHLPEDARAICGFSIRAGRILAEMAVLCPNRTRRKYRPQEPRSQRLPGFDIGSCGIGSHNRRRPEQGANVRSRNSKARRWA